MNELPVSELSTTRVQKRVEAAREPNIASARKPLRVWCLLPDQHDHIRPIEKTFGMEAHFIFDGECDPDRMVRGKPDLVLCVNEFPLATANCLLVARSRRIPTLLLQDGILEWRCQYENPLFGAGGGPAQHQPVLADKVACLGDQSARLIQSWGNEGRVAVTGIPRFDHLLSRPRVPRQSPGRRVLLMTAKNPGFTKQQRDISIRSLVDVAAALRGRPEIQVYWRVAAGVAREIGVADQPSVFSSVDLASALEQVDAVITTPTTAMLEAMLLDRPVAALDYHNVPRFVSTVWTISARDHIAPVLESLLNPAENKMEFQRFLLRDCLACNGPASPRVVSLIRGMVEASRGPSLQQAEIGFTTSGVASAGTELPRLDVLYPSQPLFGIRDLPVLQSYVARLQKENERLRRDIQHRTLANGLFQVGRLVSARLKRKR